MPWWETFDICFCRVRDDSGLSFLLVLTFQMPSVTLLVNGTRHDVDVDDASTPLLWVLRDNLGLTGTKYGCGMSLCGACTVHVNGAPVRACSIPAIATANQPITTIEGLAGEDDVLTPIQEAWIEHDVPQCGYCQAGQIMSAAALLKQNPSPSDDDIDAAMSGNICRCGTYVRIRRAIHAAAGNAPAKGGVA